jgi:hypothetical protein
MTPTRINTRAEYNVLRQKHWGEQGRASCVIVNPKTDHMNKEHQAINAEKSGLQSSKMRPGEIISR